MKRNLFAFAAILLAIGFSAFTDSDKKKDLISYYYFQISGSYDPAVPVLQEDAEFIQFSEAIPDGVGCTSTSKQCVSGFTSSQVLETSPGSGIFILKNDSQTPATTPKRKAS